MSQALLQTALPLPRRRQGKVRDLYDVELPDGGDGVLIVATDRISAFDVVMANGIAGKGIVLTELARFWFEWTARHFGRELRHHLVSTDPAAIPGLDAAWREQLAGRVMLCRRVRVLPVECIVRGYLAGSGFKDYRATGGVCGIPLPRGLMDGDALPEPVFTPSTKAEQGHDENIDFETAAAALGGELMARLRTLTLELYTAASRYAQRCGLILADTKFEFGLDASGEPVLADEILTPDSSRFWPAERWTPGGEQESFDKQFVRDYLDRCVAAGQWDRRAPGPHLPEDVVERTRERYLEAYRRLTGRELDALVSGD